MLDNLNLGLVYLNPPFGHKVSKDEAFLDHEVALFPVKYQVLLLALLQDFVQILKAMIKSFSIDQKSSMKTSMISSIMSEKIDIMHCWNDAGALHNLKDICLNAYIPYGQVKVVLL